LLVVVNFVRLIKADIQGGNVVALAKAQLNTTYIIEMIDTQHEDMRDFLFTLGCYPGEKVTIISRLAGNYIINIKDARYSIDETLANAIFV